MRITTTLMLFLLLQNLKGQELKTFKTWYDPYTKTKVHEVYTTLPTPPYLKHGAYKEFDEHGYPLKEYNFSNGKKNGICKTFYGMSMASLYDDGKGYLGKVFSSTTYKADVLNGPDVMYDYTGGIQRKKIEKFWVNDVETKVIRYHDNGTKKEELQTNGLCTTYYPNGKIESKYTQVDGVPNGISTEYYPDGAISAKSKYVNGIGVDTIFIYYGNGKLKSYSVLDGQSNIALKFEEFATNGNLKIDKSKTDDITLNVLEYDTITKEISAKYTEKYSNSERKLMKRGRYEVYENGKLRVSKNYSNDGTIRDETLDGPYIKYDIKGDTVVLGQLRNNKFDGRFIFVFDKNGEHPTNLDSAAYFRIVEFYVGSFSGKAKDFYMDKTLQWEGKLIGMYPDVMEGACVYYYPNGKNRWKAVTQMVIKKENGNFIRKMVHLKRQKPFDN